MEPDSIDRTVAYWQRKIDNERPMDGPRFRFLIIMRDHWRAKAKERAEAPRALDSKDD